jgi:hypothetical protein
LQHAFPEFSITPYLLLADKNRYASVEGLNQHFFIKKDRKKDRTVIELKGDVSRAALGDLILSLIPVQKAVETIWQNQESDPAKRSPEKNIPYENRLREYAKYYCDDKPYPVTLGSKCKNCEYRIEKDKLNHHQRSGFRQCWSEALGWGEEQFKKPHIFDIWYFGKSEECLAQGVALMEDLDLEAYIIKMDKNGKQTDRSRRQKLQIERTLSGENTEVVDPGLFPEMNKCVYPLHFLDFETSMVAIPFNKQRRPYEQIAFQFSCHTVHKDGQFTHQEWISAEPGKFPNFELVRELKKVLEKDKGTIFRYANHENTVLRQIHDQLLDARDHGRGELPADHAELIRFIDRITRWKVNGGKEKEKYECGPRCMVDMLELVIKYYYHPSMQGTNSIKAVLPSIFSISSFLKEKYSNRYSGTNFKDMIWWQPNQNTGEPSDPYKLLPPLHENIDLSIDELILESGAIEKGGAAMIAWARMQFTDMKPAEREAIIKGLLRYCELDTLAMVMIWKHWKSLKNRG